MKYTNLKAFEKHLQGSAPNHFSDCYLILMKDDYERKVAYDVLLQYLLPDQAKANASHLISCFDADKHTASDVLQELNTFSMFTGKRIVVLAQAEKLSKADMQAFEGYFTKANSKAYFIIQASSVHHATNFYKKLEKAGVVLEITEEKSWEKEKSAAIWIQEKLTKENKRIEPQALQVILKQIGTDYATLYSELEKLLCYIGERPTITMADVNALTTSCNLDTVWQLGESIFMRDVVTALKISKGMIADGIQAFLLIRQIRFQFQTDYQICSLLHNGQQHEIGQCFPNLKGFILDKHIHHAKHYGLAKFKQGMLNLDQAEIAAKNSMQDPELLIEKLIIKLTGSL